MEISFLDFDITEEQGERFNKLYELFSEWNQKMNLSSIKDKNEIYEKHFADSLLATKHFDFSNKNILDLGAGGGFPCLPLAIISDNSHFCALDSVGKKMKAVQDMADQIHLKVKTFHGRIEEFGQKKNFREKFDVVTARALAPWPTLLEYSMPFVKKGGVFIAYQGPAIEKDLEEFNGVEKHFGGVIENVFKDSLKGIGERYFVIVRKKKITPTQFPRKIGVPKNSPISL